MRSLSKFMLPLQGANRIAVIFTQGVAIGLEYIGLSARKRALKGQNNLAPPAGGQRPGGYK